jgi:hypothetical protein
MNNKTTNTQTPEVNPQIEWLREEHEANEASESQQVATDNHNATMMKDGGSEDLGNPQVAMLEE